MEQKYNDNAEIYALIRKREEKLDELIRRKKKELTQYPENLPQGVIMAARNGRNLKREQYYLRSESSEKCGKYVRKTPQNKEMVRMLIQREYDLKILKISRAEYHYWMKGEKYFNRDSLREAFESMGPLKQKWIKSVQMSDEEYVRQWKEAMTPSAPYKHENLHFQTKQDEYVRSKSELLIANTLFDYKIPYQYECPLYENKRIWALPDFTVLNVRKRKTYYWEHFGMMGDSEYAQNALQKMRNYEKHCLFSGTELIYTFESSEAPLAPESIEAAIKNYLI